MYIKYVEQQLDFFFSLQDTLLILIIQHDLQRMDTVAYNVFWSRKDKFIAAILCKTLGQFVI